MIFFCPYPIATKQ